MRLARSSAGAGLLTAVLLASAMFVAACNSVRLTPAGPLVGASQAQFSPAISVTVTNGSAASPVLVSGNELWWITEPTVSLSVTNDTAAAQSVAVLATVETVPCASSAVLHFSTSDGRQVQINATAQGSQLSLPVEVAAHQTQLISVAVVGPPCHMPQDIRSLYAVLVNLRAQ
jgi:hypothetical protein